jgi:hypothetical protein
MLLRPALWAAARRLAVVRLSVPVVLPVLVPVLRALAMPAQCTAVLMRRVLEVSAGVLRPTEARLWELLARPPVGRASGTRSGLARPLRSMEVREVLVI